MVSTPGFERRPHWWEASALTTAPPWSLKNSNSFVIFPKLSRRATVQERQCRMSHSNITTFLGLVSSAVTGAISSLVRGPSKYTCMCNVVTQVIWNTIPYRGHNMTKWLTSIRNLLHLVMMCFIGYVYTKGFINVSRSISLRVFVFEVVFMHPRTFIQMQISPFIF